MLSVFGRTGDVKPSVDDYAGIYEQKDAAILRSDGTRVAQSIGTYDNNGKLSSAPCSIGQEFRCNFGSTAGMVTLGMAGSGINSFTIAAKNTMATSVCIVMPDLLPKGGQVLAATDVVESKADGTQCIVMTWK